MIYLLLADGFEEVEALTPLDMLRRAGKTVYTVSVSKDRTVQGAHGISVLADLLPNEVKEPCDQMLILPGGMPGTRNLDASYLTDRMLSEVLSNGGHIGAICAAPLILGKRGLLKDKKAVCYPGFENELEGATVLSAGVVTDGNITTATGAGVAVLFGAALVSVLCGREVSEDMLTSFRYTDLQNREWFDHA